MNPCPIPGCPASTRAGQLLCGKHWHAVPFDLKSKVWITWRAFTKGETPKARLDSRKPYQDARQAAIDSVTQAESPLCD